MTKAKKRKGSFVIDGSFEVDAEGISNKIAAVEAPRAAKAATMASKAANTVAGVEHIALVRSTTKKFMKKLPLTKPPNVGINGTRVGTDVVSVARIALVMTTATIITRTRLPKVPQVPTVPTKGTQGTHCTKGSGKDGSNSSELSATVDDNVLITIHDKVTMGPRAPR